jgi:nitrate reductase NapE component
LDETQEAVIEETPESRTERAEQILPSILRYGLLAMLAVVIAGFGLIVFVVWLFAHWMGAPGPD